MNLKDSPHSPVNPYPKSTKTCPIAPRILAQQPRHDQVTLATDLVLLGNTDSDPETQALRVWINDSKAFDGNLEPTSSDELPAEVVPGASGTLTNGMTYHKVKLTLSVPDASSAPKG